jgi:regulatory protein
MVHFEPKDESAAAAAPERRGRLATVSYLPGAGAPNDDVDEADALTDADRESGPKPDAEADPEMELAEQVLLQRLRGRSLSLSEARGVLIGLELAEGDVEEIIERFVHLDYLDEAKLAEQIVYSQHERKGLGRSGVQAEMRRRGMDKELIADTIDAMPDDETERATEVAIKRIQQLGRLDDRTIDRRLNAFLMRKGYPSSVVREAVQAALASRNGGGGSSGVQFR